MPTVKVRRVFNIVLDIYGTITSLKFIDELKQYALNNLHKYLKEQWGDRRLVRLLDKLKAETTTLKNKDGMPEILDYGPKADAAAAQQSIVDHIAWRVKTNQESQYIIFLWEGVWEDGYKSKQLKAHIFEDVPKALHRWRYELFIKVYTLASGKKKGQHIFLKHTTQGDLVNLIANYLDCSAFGKEDRRCYANITTAIRENPENMMFVTDNPREAQAAAEEKFQVVVIVREGNEPLTEEDKKKFKVVNSLLEIEFFEPDKNDKQKTDKQHNSAESKSSGKDDPKDTKEKPSDDKKESTATSKDSSNEGTKLKKTPSKEAGNGQTSKESRNNTPKLKTPSKDSDNSGPK